MHKKWFHHNHDTDVITQAECDIRTARRRMSSDEIESLRDALTPRTVSLDRRTGELVDAKLHVFGDIFQT